MAHVAFELWIPGKTTTDGRQVPYGTTVVGNIGAILG